MLRRGWLASMGVATATVLALTAWNVSLAQDAAGGAKRDAKTIIDTATASADHKTLCEFIKLAGLDATLKEPGPYTLLGPTDAAFAKLDKKTLDDLKKPESKAKLKNILENHIVKGKSHAADITKAKTIKTMAGNELTVMEKDGKVMIGTAAVTKADIDCSNGCIHVIDTVLIPAEKK